MTRAIVTPLVLAAVLLQAVPALPHHSNVAYEVTKVITITGVVKSFEWVNPHTWLTVVVDDGKGGKVEWACEGRAPGILTRAGWTRSVLKAGETVTVDMSPAKDGSRVSIIARVTKADGTVLSNQPQFDPRGNYDAPSLTPEYLATWEEMRKSRMAGSYEFDNNAKCLPPGMPAMMSMAYGMEIMQTKDRITFFSELNDALRRVHLDGRKPLQKHLDDPTYAGYSTGRWEGDTLVVDTVALHPDSFIEGFTPHSDAMTVHERIRLIAPDVLEDRITVTDPKALTRPWEVVRTYRRAAKGTTSFASSRAPRD